MFRGCKLLLGDLRAARNKKLCRKPAKKIPGRKSEPGLGDETYGREPDAPFGLLARLESVCRAGLACPVWHVEINAHWVKMAWIALARPDLHVSLELIQGSLAIVCQVPINPRLGLLGWRGYSALARNASACDRYHSYAEQ